MLNVRSDRIAVIIPNYNYGLSLANAVYSVQRQTQPVDYIIISDDNSSDSSKSVISGLIKKFNNLIVVNSNKTTGPSAARNRGIRAAWGLSDIDYIGFLDSDDLYEKDKVQESISVLKKYPGIGMVYSDYYIQNNIDNTRRIEYKEPFSLKRLHQECFGHTPIIRKNVIGQVGLFDEELRVAEDWDMWIRIGEKFPMYHIPKPLHTYTVHENGTTNKVNKEVWQKCWQRVSQKILERNNG